jgi:hypothetical protein
MSLIATGNCNNLISSVNQSVYEKQQLFGDEPRKAKSSTIRILRMAIGGSLPTSPVARCRGVHSYGQQQRKKAMQPAIDIVNWAAEQALTLVEIWALIAERSGFVGAWRLTAVCRASRTGVKSVVVG